MALVFESQNQNFLPPLGPRQCGLRSISIQANLSDLINNLKLSDFEDENSEKHLKRFSDFRNEDPKKHHLKVDPDSLRNFKSKRSFPKSSSSPCLRTQNLSRNTGGPSIKLISTSKPPSIKELMAEAANAIKLGLHPMENQGERSQTFKIKNDDNKSVAVIKPMDIEATAAREVAAYILDHKGFAGVTPSAIVKISHPDFINMGITSASLQRYIPHIADAREMGPSQFTVASVHRIGLLDIRLLNIDRHTGNLLVRKKIVFSNSMTDANYDLLPIDHELCMPEELKEPYFEWLHWKQASVPFSDYEKDYISSLDPFKDADLLRFELPQIKEAAIRVFILCTIFLKKAISAGLCLADIGDMMTPEFNDKQSGLESLCRSAAGLLCIENSIHDTNDNRYEEDMNEPHFEMEAADIPFTSNKTAGFEGLAKTKSLPDTDFGYQRKYVSFGMLSEEEWLKFLERFEEILPPSFEAKMNKSLKLKVGVSCNF